MCDILIICCVLVSLYVQTCNFRFGAAVFFRYIAKNKDGPACRMSRVVQVCCTSSFWLTFNMRYAEHVSWRQCLCKCCNQPEMCLRGVRESSSLNITHLSPKAQQVSSAKGRTGESTWRLSQRSLLARLKKKHPSEIGRGSEHEINGAYLKDIREQSSCHIPVIKNRNLAFQHTVKCFCASDSPVCLLLCLISMRCGVEDSQRCLGPGSGSSCPTPGSPAASWEMSRGESRGETVSCRPRSPSFTF